MFIDKRISWATVLVLIAVTLLFGIMSAILRMLVDDPPPPRVVERVRVVEKIVEVPVEKKVETPAPVILPPRPAAPKDFQTFLFHVQVSTDMRHDAAYAEEQIKKLCSTVKLVSGVNDAIPVKLYGVYLHEGKAYCEPLD